MAAAADLVLKNFVWRIETLTPTETTLLSGSRFVHVDPWRCDPGTLTYRRFSVLWRDSDEDHTSVDGGVTDSLSQRPAMHRFEVSVYYPRKSEYHDLQTAILRDRHDITKQVRNPDNFVGYSATVSTGSIGLYNRIREGDSLDLDDEEMWVYRATWRCIINETEN